MGWASGSELMGGIIKSVRRNVDKDTVRAELYKDMISLFQREDCDTLGECLGYDICFDVAYRELNPEEDDE